MINKFKNVLKAGKKNKDVEEVTTEVVEVVEENSEINTDSSEVASEEVESTDSAIEENESIESAEELVVEEDEEKAASTQGASFRKEKDQNKTIEDAGIPVEEFELKELISSTLKQFAPVIIKKGIRLELDGLDKKIKTNEEVMLFIFQEILSNAVNSLVEGSIKIYVNGDKLVFEDTGYGIPANEVELIFNEGFMASNAAPSEDLEGMGMYKCSIALEKMNYAYEIKSTEGEGTTFSIDL